MSITVTVIQRNCFFKKFKSISVLFLCEWRIIVVGYIAHSVLPFDWAN
jgi:hypothetical protein